MLGMHLTFSTYGFWPPNDPRGSGSSTVRAQHLYKVGGTATKVRIRRSVASRPHDRQLVKRIKAELKFPPVTLTGKQAQAVGRGIVTICPKINLTVHALAVLPDHVHLVVQSHHFKSDELIACLQRAATRELNLAGLHPMQEFRRTNGKLPTPWTKRGWSVFLNTLKDMQRAIRYVEQNPVRAGLPRQRWSCVKPFVA
ncbi:MAG: transposase [Pirellulales bacterium]|nr:transposase [Pirellulales bacterium]